VPITNLAVAAVFGEMADGLGTADRARAARRLAGARQPVGQARRGWLAPDNVLNTRAIAQMCALLRRNRSASVADLGTAA
jgi:hypothetical protein